MLRLYYLNGTCLCGREEAALSLLTPDRRSRYRKCRDRDTALGILAAGLLLRYALGPEAAARLKKGPHGKPLLPGGPAFNLTHSGPMAALVTGSAEDGPVGIDAEHLDRTIDHGLERVLRAAELEQHLNKPYTPFSWFWTRKEAVMKQCGLGLGLDARSLEVLEPAIELEGKTLYLWSCLIDDIACSTCAAVPGPPEIHALTAEDVLADSIAR